MRVIGWTIGLVAAAVLVEAAAMVSSVGESGARFRRFDDTQGLAAEEVTTLRFDRRGFLWVGTTGGLLRFDGYRFKEFDPDPDPATHNHVSALLEDRAGRFWVGTEEGLDLFDRATSTFERVRRRSEEPPAQGDRGVTALLEDARGRVWVGTAGDGVCALVPGDLELDCRAVDPQALSSASVTSLAESANGVIWASTYESGLNRIEAETGTVTQYRHDPADPATLSSDRINTLFVDTRGSLWVGTYDAGLNRVDPATGAVTRFQRDPSRPGSLGGRAIKTIAEDREGSLWLGFWGHGLDRFDSSTGRFEHYRHDADDPGSLNDDRVLALAEDSLGQLWVGTYYGLGVLDPAPRVFRLYRHRPRDPTSLINDRVRSVAEDRQGRIWVGTYNRGATRFDPASGEVRHFVHDPGDPGSLANNAVWAIHEDASGHLWLGTSRGLNRWDPESEGFVRYQRDPRDPAPFSGSNALVVSSSASGHVWVGTWEGGLNRFDPSTGECVHHLPDDDDPGSLPEGGVWAVVEDRERRVWVGLGGGLARLNHDGKSFTRFVHDPADPSSLSAGGVVAIFEDSTGRLWFGSPGGLDLWDPATEGFDQPLASAGRFAVKSIVEAPPGVLWLGTDRGLARFDTGQGSLDWFDDGDGLQDNSFTIGAASHGRSGTLYFGGPGGLSAFDPTAIRTDTAPPPVALTELLLLNHPVRPGGQSPLRRDIGHTSELVLEPRQYSFSLEFAALSFRRPEKTRYAYKLEGIDPGWVPTDSRVRRATYTALPPGHYTFLARAAKHDGVWSDPVTLEVTVLPPWWKSTWFRALVGLALLGLVAGVFRWRTVALRRRNLRLEELVAQRTTELEESNRRLEEASLTDPLTGLRNRRFLAQHLESDVGRVLRAHHGTGEDGAEPPSEAALVAVLVDLDRFKSVNDTWGHAAGDAVLKQVAGLLRSQSRASDLVIRWGGEEFLVVARFISPAGAFETGDRIRQAVAEADLQTDEGRSLPITCSVGVATYPFLPHASGEVSWERVVALADLGLNAAKRTGRNRTIQVRGTKTTVASTLASEIGGGLEKLVQEGQLALVTSEDGPTDPRKIA